MNNRIYYSEEAEQQARRQQTLAVIIFTAFGIGIGTALALLFAPSKGEVTRQSIAHTGNDAMHKLEEEMAELRKRIEDRVQN
jgi:gas vesicle protein